MARFVLVHGAWHGPWCFQSVVEGLARRGHQATAVELPCEEVGLDLHAYAGVVGPQPDAIVVGHSLGGLTIALVPARRRVYLAALVPVENLWRDAFVDGFGGAVRDELDRSYWPDADTCAARLYPDCTREQSDWAFARLRRQARIEPVTAQFGAGDVVVATMRDAAVDPVWQVRTAQAHGAELVELDAGHSPFLTQPDELAAVLASLA